MVIPASLVTADMSPLAFCGGRAECGRGAAESRAAAAAAATAHANVAVGGANVASSRACTAKASERASPFLWLFFGFVLGGGGSRRALRNGRLLLQTPAVQYSTVLDLFSGALTRSYFEDAHRKWCALSPSVFLNFLSPADLCVALRYAVARRVVKIQEIKAPRRGSRKHPRASFICATRTSQQAAFVFKRGRDPPLQNPFHF